MTTNEPPLRRRDGAVGSDQYLDSTVRSASPARLRLMLIERAVDVSGWLAKTWRSGQEKGVNEHSIKLLDLLNELLDGVVGSKNQGENEICEKVADLYVFLTKHLILAEKNSDADAMDEIKSVLEIEAETWRAVCAQSLPSLDIALPFDGASQSSGLNLEA
jgi:flagellar protein FliS